MITKDLSYDPATGVFVRVDRGGVAGTLHPSGYVHIGYAKRKYKAHRLAWFFVHGYWPKHEIDHINGDKADNRIINLREATHKQGSANRPVQKNSTSGVKGVYWERYATGKPWRVQINGTYIGTFRTKEKAIEARKQAEEKYHGEFKCNWSRRDQVTNNYVLNNKLKLKEKSMTKQEQKLDKVVATYIKVRDARIALKRQYEEEDNKLKAQLETLDGFFLETLQSQGLESMKTKYGTVYQSLSIKPSCGDWDAFGNWIIENNAIEALERRVKKSFIVDYMTDNNAELPPGISVLKEYTVTIRRS